MLTPASQAEKQLEAQMRCELESNCGVIEETVRRTLISLQTGRDMVTKKTLAAIPDIPSLKKLSQSLAMLDAIMSPEWDYRYYSFDSKWAAGEMMASMRNGCG